MEDRRKTVPGPIGLKSHPPSGKYHWHEEVEDIGLLQKLARKSEKACDRAWYLYDYFEFRDQYDDFEDIAKGYGITIGNFTACIEDIADRLGRQQIALEERIKAVRKYKKNDKRCDAASHLFDAVMAYKDFDPKGITNALVANKETGYDLLDIGALLNCVEEEKKNNSQLLRNVYEKACNRFVKVKSL